MHESGPGSIYHNKNTNIHVFNVYFNVTLVCLTVKICTADCQCVCVCDSQWERDKDQCPAMNRTLMAAHCQRTFAQEVRLYCIQRKTFVLTRSAVQPQCAVSDHIHRPRETCTCAVAVGGVCSCDVQHVCTVVAHSFTRLPHKRYRHFNEDIKPLCSWLNDDNAIN